MQLTIAPQGAGGIPLTAVHIGPWHRKVPCMLDRESGLLALPEDIRSETGLAPGDTVHGLLNPSGSEIRLGPLVGVLLDTGSIHPESPSWSERYDTVEEEARKACVIPLFLDIKGIDPAAGTASGWIRQGRTWRQTVLPVPDLIYHRATFADVQDRKVAAKVLGDIQQRWGTWLVNGVNALSKSQVAEALSFFPETASLAPETTLFRHREDLERMLERYRSVFAKADRGSHGSNVLRIDRDGKGWLVKGKCGGQPVNEFFADVNALWCFLALLGGQNPWVLQQGIAVPEEDGRVFDVRVIVQKDGSGEWRAPLVLVRRSHTGNVAANMSQGGEPFLPNSFVERFGHNFPWLDGFEERVREAAFRTAEALESRFGLLGEIGVDLGLDHQGQPWIFEANTKPLHPVLPDLPEPLKRLPFQYSGYLAMRAWLGRSSGLDAPVE